ncbi:hypothetical protein [Duganella vulcania]|uniref:Uncharacterized protein n=1 Tax=Duganella vulcania TaxID=2692166 RepID=A0A845GHC5_9BURK|nr:hypothetical protein [Duganella vulcania]MYM92418.1 hypothetical protein [Duganella vulcania]
MKCNNNAALLDLVGVLLRADREEALSDVLHNEGIGDAYAQAMVEALKALGRDGVAVIAHRYETAVPAELQAMLAEDDGKSAAAPAAPPSLEDDAFAALELLLEDVDAIACGVNCYGMPVESEEHPFHVSVLQARDVLSRRRNLGEAAKLPNQEAKVSAS